MYFLKYIFLYFWSRAICSTEGQMYFSTFLARPPFHCRTLYFYRKCNFTLFAPTTWRIENHESVILHFIPCYALADSVSLQRKSVIGRLCRRFLPPCRGLTRLCISTGSLEYDLAYRIFPTLPSTIQNIRSIL